MTKREYIKLILGIEKIDTEANLMKKSLGELEKLYKQLKSQIESEDVDTEEDMDKDAIIAQLQAELEKAKVEAKAVNEDSEEEVQSKKFRSDIPPNQLITVMNITNGELIYVSKKTGAEWRFLEYGDMESIEFHELLTMRSSQRRFYDEPFILVMDDEVVDYLGLKKMYDTMVKPESIDDIFRMKNDDFQEVLMKAPKGIKHLIITRAKQKYEDGSLDSVRKINFINENFGTDIGQRG